MDGQLVGGTYLTEKLHFSPEIIYYALSLHEKDSISVGEVLWWVGWLVELMGLA